jgi:site-specific DNA recombinase
LQNRIYVGEIQHRGQLYRGEHTGIVPRELWEKVQAQLRSDNHGRRTGLKANCSSLLVGLLQDAEGNRFTPSYTVKNGRRYRYYVCQGKIDGRAAQSRPARLPAHDVEKQVCLRLRSFLQSASEVMDELTRVEDPPAITQQIMASAGKQAEQLQSGSPSSVQDLVRKVVRRIVIHSDRIEVEFSKRELRTALAGDLRAPSRQGSDDVIRRALEARIRRCGGEMRLVVPSHLTGQTPAHLVPSLLKALARGRQWYEWVIAGEVWGRRSIARKAGFDERHVGQILECAFLAPDIVEAILDGRQPPDLTWRKLTRHLPLSWVEQRKQLGFPPTTVAATNRLL